MMSRSTNQKIDSLKLSPSQDFHKSTKINKLSKEVSPEKWPTAWKKIYFKGYPRFPEIVLSKPSLPANISLKWALQHRRSSREFSSKSLTEKEISNLLYYSFNIRKVKTSWSANRFYPSAGSRYPLEIYPIILNTKSLDQGIYHYYIKRHSLELLLKHKFKKELFGSFNSPWIKKSGILILLSAVFSRSEIKYGSRGYRHILTEVGHLSQNIYLASAALKLDCCSIGGYMDDKLNELLDLDGLEESVVGVTAVGKR